MHFERIFIICNPTAGEGLAKKRWKRFKQQLELNGISFDYQLTQSPNHATEIASDCIKCGYHRIAVFGGDGTLNEVLQGIMYNDLPVSQDIRLMFFAAGSSCDFDKKFSDKSNPMDRILRSESRAIDLCKVECRSFDGSPTVRYCINNSSIGVTSKANEKFCSGEGVTKWLKRISVDLAAITSGLSAISRFESLTGDLTIDGESYEKNRFCNLTVFKTPYFGGGMNYGLETVQDDGILHLAIVDSVSRLKLLSLIPFLYTGTVLDKKEVYHQMCTRVELKSDQDFIIEVDGEFAGYPPVKYSVLQQVLQVIV